MSLSSQKVLMAAIGMLGGGLLVMRGMIRKALSCTPLLASALAGGLALVLGLATLLYRDLRRSEISLSMRLRAVRHASGPSEPRRARGVFCHHSCLRIVTSLGDAIARSVVRCPPALWRSCVRRWIIAGFRGRHGLGLFVGTKFLLVVWPAARGGGAAMAAAPECTASTRDHPAVAAGIGLLAPDPFRASRLRKKYLRALDARHCRTRST